ncbi:SO2930 family diheme c-type cytochrome [uncultured Arcticibacterium sp.]|uniref:SO2930 family diheme c-type cytochrome n=1 Tax=uncultured Arcticibacterium sp. TaxID=2173042 RepID=UPI0030F8E5CB
MKLSDYGFFEGELSDLSPTDEVHPYSLKTALFTDYAEKLRFVVLPKGAKINYNATEVLDFPEGTTLIKTFYYPKDFTKPKKGRRLLETRLLIRNEKGWRALPYVWNEDQTEAYLEVAGETFEVKYVDINGKKKKHLYGVPNLNQCKGCHNRDEVLMPIGPSARQLNSELDIPAYLSSNALKTYQKENQLDMLIDKGILDHVPENHAFPEIANWQDNDAPLDARARAWLDINCAHCHRPDGPANTSGLNLSIHNTDATSLGILKAPVATGRASGDLVADITPGKADESILVRRLAATDPGVMMPELGRKTVHQESLQLIKDWINQMD